MCRHFLCRCWGRQMDLEENKKKWIQLTPNMLMYCKLIKGLTVHKIFWTPVSVRSSSGRWCGCSAAYLSVRCPGQWVSCGPGGCLPFWCSGRAAAPLLPWRGSQLECPELPVFPARSIARGVVALLPNQRRHGFRRSKWSVPNFVTEAIWLFVGPWLVACPHSIRREADQKDSFDIFEITNKSLGSM